MLAKGLELIICSAMVVLMLAVTLIDLTNAASDIPGVSAEINALEGIIPDFLIISCACVALGCIVFLLKGRVIK